MNNPYREKPNMDPEIEKRVSNLEKSQRDAAGENAVIRTVVRCICLAAIITLATAYGCNREEQRAKVDVARVTCEALTKK